MPTMEIDGKKVAWEGKKMILQVAQDNGIEIPSYCYHPGLSIVASCRICLGEIESPDPRTPRKLVKVPKLVPLLPDARRRRHEGVPRNPPKPATNQKAVMEFLLINHPLDCPVCDQAGECLPAGLFLQIRPVGIALPRRQGQEAQEGCRRRTSCCIPTAASCARGACASRGKSPAPRELAVFGRGHKEEIDVFPGKPVNNPLAGNVIDICPVGALLDKDFLFTQRVWFLKATPSISPVNAGGENIEIHHTEGRIYRIKPRFNKDVNKWWISDEAAVWV